MQSAKDIHVFAQQFQWQSGYYDHIIRTEQSLFNIREYIKYNPLKWEQDPEHPQSIKKTLK